MRHEGGAAAQQFPGPVAEDLLLEELGCATRASPRRLLRDPPADAHGRAVRPREPEEFVMIGDRGVRQEGADGRLERLGALDQIEPIRGHARDRHLEDDADGAESETGRLEEIRILRGRGLHDVAVGQGEAQGSHHAGEPREAGAGAVGPGLDGAGDRLAIDVAHDGQRETVGGQQLRDLPESGAAPQSHQARCWVRTDQPGQRIQAHRDAVGRGQRSEGVPAADHPERQLAGPREREPLEHAGLVARGEEVLGAPAMPTAPRPGGDVRCAHGSSSAAWWEIARWIPIASALTVPECDERLGPGAGGGGHRKTRPSPR